MSGEPRRFVRLETNLVCAGAAAVSGCLLVPDVVIANDCDERERTWGRPVPFDERGPWAGLTEIDERTWGWLPAARQRARLRSGGKHCSGTRPGLAARSGVRAHPNPTQLTNSHETTVGDFVDFELRLNYY